MEIFMKSLIVFSFIVIVNGFYIKEKDNESNSKIVKNKEISDYSKILESWSNFKRKLLEKYNKDNILKNNFDESSNSFNELEAVKMIPIIIDQLRHKKLTSNDIEILSEIYGTLWNVICEESVRPNDTEKNQILESLLQSFYLTDDKINNDIEGNTVYEKRKLPKISKATNKLLLNISKSDHPSQRVLNTAAMLIHQVMNSSDMKKKTNIIKMEKKLKNSKKPKRIQRRPTLNLQLTNIPINDISRSKRNLNFHISNTVDLSSEKIDAILKIYKEKYNIKDSDEDEDDDEDDDYDDSDSIEMKNTLMSNDARDDLYDDLYEDDQEVLSHHESDYSSFQDLILLAGKNRLREEEEENRLKHIQNKRNFLSAK